MEHKPLVELQQIADLDFPDCLLTDRSDDSPLSIAYNDPLLRSSGLKSDRVGDCTDFFGLTDDQMHHAFCSCHTGVRLTGAQAAARLQAVVDRAHTRHASGGLWQALRRVFRAA